MFGPSRDDSGFFPFMPLCWLVRTHAAYLAVGLWVTCRQRWPRWGILSVPYRHRHISFISGTRLFHFISLTDSYSWLIHWWRRPTPLSLPFSLYEVCFHKTITISFSSIVFSTLKFHIFHTGFAHLLSYVSNSVVAVVHLRVVYRKDWKSLSCNWFGVSWYH